MSSIGGSATLSTAVLHTASEAQGNLGQKKQHTKQKQKQKRTQKRQGSATDGRDKNIELGEDLQFVQLAVAGRQLVEQARFKQAEPYLKAALVRGTSDYVKQISVHRYYGKCLLRRHDFDGARHQHEAELHLAQENNDFERVSRGYLNLGIMYQAWRRFNEGIQCYEKGIEVATLTKQRQLELIGISSISDAYVALANVWHTRGRGELASEYYASAEKYLSKGTSLATKLKDATYLSRMYGQLGTVYEQQGAQDKALAVYKKRLKIATKAEDLAAQSRTLCNMGNIYRVQSKHKKALQCYEQDLEICVQLQDEMSQAITCNNIACYYQTLGDVDRTILFMERYIALMTALEHHEGLMMGLSNLSRVYEVIGKYDDALEQSDKWLLVARECDSSTDICNAQENMVRLRQVRSAAHDRTQGSAAPPVQDPSQALAASIPTETVPKRTIRGTLGRLRRKRSTITSAGVFGASEAQGAGSTSTDADVTDGDVQLRNGSMNLRARMKNRMSRLFISAKKQDTSGFYLPDSQDTDVTLHDGVDDGFLPGAQRRGRASRQVEEDELIDLEQLQTMLEDLVPSMGRDDSGEASPSTYAVSAASAAIVDADDVDTEVGVAVEDVESVGAELERIAQQAVQCAHETNFHDISESPDSTSSLGHSERSQTRVAAEASVVAAQLNPLQFDGAGEEECEDGYMDVEGHVDPTHAQMGESLLAQLASLESQFASKEPSPVKDKQSRSWDTGTVYHDPVVHGVGDARSSLDSTCSPSQQSDNTGGTDDVKLRKRTLRKDRGQRQSVMLDDLGLTDELSL
eukprot:m.35783 g.35783  ORF g.35783 m.35783 type:complete len:804 (+) comp9921_c0_seq2:92-2503(+)